MSLAGKVIRFGIDDQEDVDKLCNSTIESFQEASSKLNEYKDMLDAMESKYIKETNDDIDVVIRDIGKMIETIIEFNSDHNNIVESFTDLDDLGIK